MLPKSKHLSLSHLKDNVIRSPMYQQLERALPGHVLSHLILILAVSPVLLLTYLLWPQAVPHSLFEFWTTKGSLADWLSSAKWLLVWAFGINAFFLAQTFNDPNDNRHAERVFKAGFWVSLSAGVMEEIAFRWILYLAAFPLLIMTNFVMFGFLGVLGLPGWGLVELFTGILAHVANFFTLGYLHEQLINASSWTIPAALLAANNAFREGHRYQGFFGYVNSWFMGMVFFYFTFTYGLVAAIVVHFLYDLVVFATVYADMKFEAWYHGRH